MLYSPELTASEANALPEPTEDNWRDFFHQDGTLNRNGRALDDEYLRDLYEFATKALLKETTQHQNTLAHLQQQNATINSQLHQTVTRQAEMDTQFNQYVQQFQQQFQQQQDAAQQQLQDFQT